WSADLRGPVDCALCSCLPRALSGNRGDRLVRAISLYVDHGSSSSGLPLLLVSSIIAPDQFCLGDTYRSSPERGVEPRGRATPVLASGAVQHGVLLPAGYFGLSHRSHADRHSVGYDRTILVSHPHDQQNGTAGVGAQHSFPSSSSPRPKSQVPR